MSQVQFSGSLSHSSGSQSREPQVQDSQLQGPGCQSFMFQGARLPDPGSQVLILAYAVNLWFF